jgi:hypothetical protein
MTASASRESSASIAPEPTRRAIEIIDPCTHPEWDPMVERESLGSLFSSSPWLRSIAETYGLEIRAAVARDESRRLSGGMPFVVIDDEVGARVRSLPFSDYCDPMARDSESLLDIVEPILDVGVPMSVRVLHDECARRCEIFEEKGSAIWHGTRIAENAESAWARLRGSSRRNIRHARDAGVRIRVGTALGDVMQFHKLHGRLRKRKYHMLAQPASFFEALHRNFSARDGIFVLFAETDEGVAAGTLFLEWGTTLYYKFNASVDTVHRPNDLLVWAGIELALSRGLKFIDFGLSDCDQAELVRFKSKFADTERRISTLTWKPSTLSAAPRGFATVLTGLTELFTDPSVPDDVTLRAGDLLYRFFA